MKTRISRNPRLPEAGEGWGEGRTSSLLALIIFTSCANPDDIFPMHGTVSLAGQHVLLERAPHVSRNECGSDYAAFKETDADGDGGYSFDIFRAQAESLSTGRRFCFQASTTYASGTVAWGVTNNIENQLEFPLLPDWDAKLSTSFGLGFYPDGGVYSTLSFDVFPIAFRAAQDTGFLDRYSVALTGADDVVQWRQGDSVIADDTLTVARFTLNADERITKEFGGGTLRATGTYTRASQEIQALNADVRTVWSPTVTATSGHTLFIDGPAQVPPSRGANCDGYATCPFTDGALDAAPMLDGGVWLRFAQPMSPTLLVVRGVVTTVEVNRDGTPAAGDTLIISAFDADGGSIGPFPGFGGVLATAPFLHDFDGPPLHLDGGFIEYPPTYLAVPLKTSAPISALHLMTSGVSAEEISVW